MLGSGSGSGIMGMDVTPGMYGGVGTDLFGVSGYGYGSAPDDDDDGQYGRMPRVQHHLALPATGASTGSFNRSYTSTDFMFSEGMLRGADSYDGDVQQRLAGAFTSGGINGAGGDGYGSGIRRLQRASRRLLGTTSPVTKVYYNEAVAMVLQQSGAKQLQYRTSGSDAFAFQTVRNIQGGTTHSPGPRLGSVMVAISGREAVLWGGWTFDPSSLSDGTISTNEMLLTNDMHYMKLYIGGETVNTTTSEIQACPDAAGGCASLMKVPWSPSTAVPSSAPVLSSSRECCTLHVHICICIRYACRTAFFASLPQCHHIRGSCYMGSCFLLLITAQLSSARDEALLGMLTP